jgi:hypothetical protein
MLDGPVARFNDNQCKSKIHHYGSNREKDIDGCMFPFVVTETDEWHHPFYQPEKSNAAGQYQGTVPAWYGIEIVNDVFEHVDCIDVSIYQIFLAGDCFIKKTSCLRRRFAVSIGCICRG